MAHLLTYNVHYTSRYVLKNKETGDVLFVVVFTLLHKEDADKEAASIAPQKATEKTKGTETKGESDFEPTADDLD